MVSIQRHLGRNFLLSNFIFLEELAAQERLSAGGCARNIFTDQRQQKGGYKGG